MKHQQQGRSFGRVRKVRRALLKTLLGSIVLHERVLTTEAKAKEAKRLFDRLVTRAKAAKARGKVAMIRAVERDLPLVAVKKITDEKFLDRLSGRNSGYTRVTKIARTRTDAASTAVIELTDRA